jgi:predicted nucleotidyltransferase
MTEKDRLTRDTINQTLVDALKPLDYVHAFWEGGAAAFNRIDEWSDIDLYVVVDNKRVEETFLAVEKALESLSCIKQKYKVLQLPWPDLSQAFYKLEDASEYLVIDLVVMKLKAQERFLEPEIHGNAVFYFNKSDRVKAPSLDREAMIGKLQKRWERLRARFDMFNIFVQKEINRGNYLEAIDFYRALTLSSLVEALRIKYNPFHHDFRMHYIHYELPSETITKLKHLYFIKDEKDLQEKYNEATKWFFKMLSEMDQKEIKRLIGIS